ncbi:MAG: SDR family oxidoreductase [Magnetococcales bacterium]|nr:SDR family oxidoreductase [Magnetococcales bacterium]
MELIGTTALITGAGRRLGAACALALANAGVTTTLHYGHSKAAASTLTEQIQQAGGMAFTLAADLADPEQATALLPRAAAVMGRVDILVNSAAIFEPGRIDDTEWTSWQRHLAINLTAPFLLTQSFAQQPHLHRKNGAGVRGKVINMLDQRIRHPRSGHLAYTTAKSALWSVTQMAALELAPTILVNAIAPGPILAAPDASQEQFQRIAATTPAGRSGTPKEITDTLLFLLRHDYMTGEMVCVDGGEHLL